MKLTLPNILGKEFDCINKIIKKLPTKSIGDDCAVLEFGGKKLLITVDTFSDKVHFDTKYFSLDEIGEKCSQAAISDIAAMGAKPLYLTLSIATPNKDLVSGITYGIKRSLLKHNIYLVGGDTTYSKILSISITVIGTSTRPVYRSGAKVGDSVYITGPTGLSAAGLYVLQNKIKGFKDLVQIHKKPSAKIKQGMRLSKIANAMIDISDGLVSELYHIAFQSKVSIEINRIPIQKELKKLCDAKKLEPEILALYGGEDYELIITGPEAKLSKIKGLIKIGKVLKPKNGVYLKELNKNKKILNPSKGFKHF